MSRTERQAERVAEACRRYRDTCCRRQALWQAVTVAPTLSRSLSRRLAAAERVENRRWLAFRRAVCRLAEMAAGGAR